MIDTCQGRGVRGDLSGVISKTSQKLSKRLLKEGVRLLSPTREDIQRYRGILGALVVELEEDGVL